MPNRQTVPMDQLSLNTARLLQQQTSYREIWMWLGGIGLALLLVLLLPWQQTVQADGKVSALSPADRPLTLPSRIDGRIEKWHVAEGALVSKGTVIVEISEIKDEYMDPDVLARTQEQLDAKRQANRDKSRKAAANEQQIAALEQTLAFKRVQARNTVERYDATVAQAALDDSVARDQYQRRQSLFASPLGLVSLNDLQTSRMKAQSAAAKLVEQRNVLANARIELDGIEAEYREKIEKVRGDRMATLADIQEGVGEISKLRNKLSSLTVRQGFQRITAPQDGYVVKAMVQGVGDLVKPGDPVVMIQPSTTQRVAEVYLRPMDVPLVSVGRSVRLIFDGWPAIQFSGWPTLSVGTFGGRVAVIDQVASENGKFRALVVPDTFDEPWPQGLRIGSGVHGWAALNTVRVWFELWRQLNGFPPSVDAQRIAGTTSSAKAGAK